MLNCDERVWNETETAKILGCSVAFLRKQRHVKSGPPYVKIGKLVRYRPEDVRSFLHQNTTMPETGLLAKAA